MYACMMMICRCTLLSTLLFTIITLSITTTVVYADASDDDIVFFDSSSKEASKTSTSIQLQHHLHSNAWIERGILMGNTITNRKLSKEDITVLYNRCMDDDTYAIQLTDGRRSVSSIVSARSLVGGSLRERIIVHTDEYGYIIGMDYQARERKSMTGTPMDADMACRWILNAKAPSFRTKVTVSTGTAGPTPYVEEYIQQKKIRDNRRMEGGDSDDDDKPKSFFARYWIYIVPILLVLLLSGGDQPPASGRGGSNAAR